ncbi:hypothetical protein ACKXF4_06210 [Faecalibacterium prausnitzii]|uniref:hypothetical protein n=1 Tax=Faecalibacterium prausnitzii TaxID=853 RepID=UPI003AAFA1B5
METVRDLSRTRWVVGLIRSTAVCRPVAPMAPCTPGIDYQVPAEALVPTSEFAAIYKEAQEVCGHA